MTIALVLSCNAPGSKPPAGIFTGKSDCPGSFIEEDVSIEVAKDYSTIIVERGEDFGLPSAQISLQQKAKSLYSLHSSDDVRTCRGHWDSPLGELYVLGCFEGNDFVCMIIFEKVY